MPNPQPKTPKAPTPEELEAKFALLDRVGSRLVETRKEAVDGRRESGIENVWTEDEEFYEGIDDKNRGAVSNAQGKPPFAATPQTRGNESIEFPNITGPYVDAAAAKVGDILIPTDDRPWSLKPTPVPELIKQAKKGGLSIEVVQGMAEANVPEDQAVAVAKTEQQAAQAMLDQSREKADRAEKRIEDWHVEGQWHAEMRQVIDDAAKVGTGVLKGPIPERKKSQMLVEGKLVIEDKLIPVSKRIDVWNCFPDPACGARIHNGRYHWERDYLTGKQLIGLKGRDGYIARQIERCIEEGPIEKLHERKTAEGRALNEKGVYEVWYFYGYATREELAAADCKCPEGAGEMIPVCMTMVNNHVIKADLNHLDTGEFPYDYMPWQKRKNSPWGTGVARKIRTPQKIVVATTRVMLTNAGRAAGPILVMNNKVKGANGKSDVDPWKIYYVGSDDVSDDVRKAMTIITIPMLQAELMAIIQYGLKLAEDVTGLPLLLQGQTGGAPDTYGGQQLVEKNASGVLRRIARMFDDCITEPHIRRYYVYLLQYGEDDFEKGEFVLDARGSTALVERELNRQYADAILQASLNPAFGISPKKAMIQKLRADNRNPKDYEPDEEELKAAQAQQGPPPDPRAEASKEVATIRAKADVERATKTAESDMAEIQAKSAEAQKQRDHEVSMAERNERIEMMKLSQAQGISLAEIKATLAGTVMKLKTQTQLSREGQAAAQVAKPPTEPVGRAPRGKAYQR